VELIRPITQIYKLQNLSHCRLHYKKQCSNVNNLRDAITSYEAKWWIRGM